MKITETRFEDKLIGALRDAGFFCIHPNIMNQDGFPDLLAVTGAQVALIEVKVIEKLTAAIHSAFQPTQAPFYHNYLKSGAASLWVAFACGGESYLCEVSPGIVKRWRELTWQKFLDSALHSWAGPPWYLATQLRQHLRGESWAG